MEKVCKENNITGKPKFRVGKSEVVQKVSAGTKLHSSKVIKHVGSKFKHHRMMEWPRWKAT
eukprot:scaffold231778_cov36-Prasinocladus_malaysianus.AAC.1